MILGFESGTGHGIDSARTHGSDPGAVRWRQMEGRRTHVA
jgi:hypothetical protein